METTKRYFSAITAALVLALAVGCGSDSDEGTSSGQADVERAEELVTQHEQPIEGFDAPGPAFDASKAEGKSIFLIAPLSIPFAQQNLEGLEEAADLVGADVTAFDGKAQVNDYVRGIKQAVAQEADVILIESLPVSLFSSDLKQAEDSDIPVISVENHDPGPPPASDPAAVVAAIDQCHACAGRMMADLAVADSDGDAEVMIAWSSDVRGIGEPQLDAIESEFSKLCPDCELDRIDVPLAQWSTELGTATQSAITSNPNLDYFLPLYDGMVPFMLPAVTQANAQDRVKIISFNATPAVMKELKNGNIVLGDVGVGNVRYGWAWADQAFRVLAGVEPVEDVNLPMRLFTPSNIDTIDINAAEETWYGDPSVWRDGYKELWGLVD